MNTIFSPFRVWLLLRSDFLRHYRSLGVSSAAVILLIFLTSIISGNVSKNGGGGFYNGWFAGMVFIYGIYLTSKAFSHMHSKTENQAYLLVPASTLEKTFAELTRVTICLVVYIGLLVSCASYLAEGVKLLHYGHLHPFFNPFTPVVWETITNYLFFQSFFFLGAAWFAKNAFIKTILSLCLILLGLILLHFVLSGQLKMNTLGLNFHQIYGKNTAGILDIVLPICCWFIAWLKVREVQVSSGV